MAHQSLYRAYRPHSFKEVLGQEQVTGPLSEQIKTAKVGHAYLFAGSRGLGKTTIARIFAKELKVSDKDLYEIDAASNNSVDGVRELAANIATFPFESAYKLYILDEVHMFSKGAWNALLKTLEEPPSHAIFVLATTELDKVPETVQSRCQVFEFKKPTRAGLAKMVAAVAKKEGYAMEASAADLIALLADGSYRDALSVLERVFASTTDKKVTREEAEAATGAPKRTLVASLVSAVSNGNTEEALVAIRAAASSNVDMGMYLTLVLEYLRSVLLVRHAPELRKEIAEEVGADEYAEVEAIAMNKESKLTHATLRIFLEASARVRYAPVPALPLELAVLELHS